MPTLSLQRPSRPRATLLLPWALCALALSFPLATSAEDPREETLSGEYTYTCLSSDLVLTAEFQDGQVQAVCALADGRHRREFTGPIAAAEGRTDALEGRSEFRGDDGGSVEYSFDVRGETAEILWTPTDGPGTQWTKWVRLDATADAAPHVESPAEEAPADELPPLAPPVVAGPFEARQNEGLKRGLVARGGGTAGSEQAVKAALLWLARHQSEDGSWSGDGFSAECTGANCDGPGYADYDAGLTGLSLLAFLGAGYTHLSKEEVMDDVTGNTIKFGEVVKKAVRWLVSQQGPDGCIGPPVSKMMYNHAICALALAEACGMTGSSLLKGPVQQAIDYLVQAKNPYKAWRYSSRCGENDTSVTGWCVMALTSAKASGLAVPQATFEEARGFLADVTHGETGDCGYQDVRDAGVKVVVLGKNEDYANHGAMAAVGMVVRMFVDHDRSDPTLELAAMLLSAADLPSWDQEAKTNDYYYWYYGTLAMFHFDGPGSGGSGHLWKPWNAAILDALVQHQKQAEAGCAAGSWEADDRWGFEGGGVYATAINALTLEVYYRYPAAFAKKK